MIETVQQRTMMMVLMLQALSDIDDWWNRRKPLTTRIIENVMRVQTIMKTTSLYDDDPEITMMLKFYFDYSEKGLTYHTLYTPEIYEFLKKKFRPGE